MRSACLNAVVKKQPNQVIEDYSQRKVRVDLNLPTDGLKHLPRATQPMRVRGFIDCGCSVLFLGVRLHSHSRLSRGTGILTRAIFGSSTALHLFIYWACCYTGQHNHSIWKNKNRLQEAALRFRSSSLRLQSLVLSIIKGTPGRQSRSTPYPNFDMEKKDPSYDCKCRESVTLPEPYSKLVISISFSHWLNEITSPVLGGLCCQPWNNGLTRYSKADRHSHVNTVYIHTIRTLRRMAEFYSYPAYVRVDHIPLEITLLRCFLWDR